MIQKIKINDKDFTEQYMAFNLAHRYIICDACLKSFDLGNWAVKKSIGIEIISQYVGMLENTAMIYYALKEFKDKSFLKSLFDVFIKESSKSDYSSEKIFKEIEELEYEKIDFENFVKKVSLPSSEEALVLAGEDLINELGGQNNTKERYKRDTINIFKSLKNAISNRFQDKGGSPLDLVKIYNKIKHGSVFKNDETNDESIYFPIEVKDLDKEGNEVLMEAYNFICNKKESLEWFVGQMKILSDNLIKLLEVFYKYNYKN